MADDNPQVEVINYLDFLQNLSRYYTGINFLKLRFCVSDHLSKEVLQKANVIGQELLNELGKNNPDNELLIPVISATRVNLLWEIVELTRVAAAQELVFQYMQSRKLGLEGEGIKPYRKILYTALIDITDGDLRNVTARYDIGHHDYKNKWDTVLHLETEEWTTRADLTTFANLLNARAKTTLIDGLAELFPEEKDYKVCLQQTGKDKLIDLVPMPEEKEEEEEEEEGGAPDGSQHAGGHDIQPVGVSDAPDSSRVVHNDNREGANKPIQLDDTESLT